MVNTRTRGKRGAKNSPPKPVAKKPRKGKKAKKDTTKPPVETVAAEDHSKEEETKMDVSRPGDAAQQEPKPKGNPGDMDGESPAVEFDKEKAIKEVNKILEQKDEKSCNEGENEESENVEARENAQDVSVKATENNNRRLYMQLKEIRTTEVEQLLQDARETAAMKEKAQNELIQELRAEVMHLKQEKEKKPDDTIEWKREYIRLKSATDELEAEVKELRGAAKSENSSAVGNSLSSAEHERLQNVCKFYQELTALRVEIKEDKGVCTATNKLRRKAVRFEIEFCQGKDGESCFRYTPTANVKLLPKSLSESKVFKHHDAQRLLSRLWESLDEE